MDSIRKCKTVKLSFERRHHCFQWFLGSRPLRIDTKFYEKYISKTLSYFSCSWNRFRIDFPTVLNPFWNHLGSQNGSVEVKKSSSEELPAAILNLKTMWIFFWMIFGPLLDHFGTIFRAFKDNFCMIFVTCIMRVVILLIRIS